MVMTMAACTRILLVEDDQRLAELLVTLLSENGYTVEALSSGSDAVDRIVSEQPDLVLLDVNLPGRDGFSVCREVRPQYHGRILMLTARGEEVDEVVGLDAGADDYMAKPASPHRLLARVRALLRRPAMGPDDEGSEGPVRSGTLLIDPQTRELSLDGLRLKLTSAEFDMIWILAKNLGRAVSREELHLQFKGHPWDGIDRTIDLGISKLRRILGDDPKDPRWIKTVRGSGYLLAKRP